MLTYNNIVFAEGIEKDDNIRHVAGWAAERTVPADLVITYWDSDGIEMTVRGSNASYYVRIWDWMVRGKKRISVMVTWSLFKVSEDTHNVQLDEGFVEIRNGRIFGGAHAAPLQIPKDGQATEENS